MATLRALLRKETREHGAAVFILVACLSTLLWLSIRGIQIQENQTSTLDFIPIYLLSYTVVAAMILSQRLVVREYQAHTQRFLETLPLQRWQGSNICWACWCWWGSGSSRWERGSTRPAATSWSTEFTSILVVKTLVYLFCLWGGCYLIGFTGRFRQPIFFGSFLLLAGTAGVTDIRIMDLPPLALVDPSVMPYERTEFPWGSLLASLLLGCVLSWGAFALATWREGQMVSRLSGRLTQREKAVACTLILAYVVAVTVIDLKKPKEPFEFSDGLILKSEVVPLEILYLNSTDRDASAALMSSLEPPLTRLQEELKLEKMPPLRVALTRNLDGITFDSASLPRKDGCLLRANFVATDFDRDGFSALMVHELLGAVTHSRAQVDPHHWFLDGFAIWWTTSHPEVRLSEALWAVEEGVPTLQELEAWSLLSDSHGDEVAGSLAYSLVRSMELQHGRDSVLELARRLYVRPFHQDAREWLHRLFHPLRGQFATVTGQSLEDFLPNWSQWLRERASDPEVKTLWEEMIRPRAAVRFEGTSLHYALEFDQLPSEGTRWALLHIKAGPSDAPINPSDYRREEHFWPPTEKEQQFSLTDEYSPGDRVSVVVTVTHPGRQHPLRVFSQRMMVP